MAELGELYQERRIQVPGGSYTGSSMNYYMFEEARKIRNNPAHPRHKECVDGLLSAVRRKHHG
ncbi:MAG: hypothetical protein LBB34_01900 [Holosporales bacterium]|nr:hypothetical protein [Holosporales bacterium]